MIHLRRIKAGELGALHCRVFLDGKDVSARCIEAEAGNVSGVDGWVLLLHIERNKPCDPHPAHASTEGPDVHVVGRAQAARVARELHRTYVTPVASWIPKDEDGREARLRFKEDGKLMQSKYVGTVVIEYHGPTGEAVMDHLDVLEAQ